MKKTLLMLLCALTILSACTTPGTAMPREWEGIPDGVYTERMTMEAELQPAYPEPLGLARGVPDAVQTAYRPAANLSQKETIAAYFEQFYKMYTSNTYTDISAILDMEQQNNVNCQVWMYSLIQRRRLIAQNNYCYVHTEQYPYTINYIAESDLKDKRMNSFKKNDGNVSLHFVIKGQAGKAYPPLLAVNTQHTIRMKQIDGMWKITFHYFPGSYRKFSNLSSMKATSDENMLARLQKEFAPSASESAPAVPDGAIAYNGANAARYAKTYTEKRNSSFYDVGDWMGNCANFTSQCIWYGFTGDGENNPSPNGKTNMTSSWYGGYGGGTPAWENVSHFWNYATTSSELKCQVLGSISSLKVGDMIQTKNNSANSFNHTLMVVDSSSLLLAQNSPGCFVYYSDLADVQTRYIRPVYFNA